MACRDIGKADQAVKEIIESTGNKDVEVYKLDLASLKSVRECAEEVNKKEQRLDVLINNAGIIFIHKLYRKPHWHRAYHVQGNILPGHPVILPSQVI